MSRNRLSELQSPSTNPYNGRQSDRSNNYDLERNNSNFVAGERYELQDRSTTQQLSLSEFLDEVNPPPL